jgi:hypothetical protein
MEHHAKGDMSADAQTKSKNDPLTHHVIGSETREG